MGALEQALSATTCRLALPSSALDNPHPHDS